LAGRRPYWRLCRRVDLDGGWVFLPSLNPLDCVACWFLVGAGVRYAAFLAEQEENIFQGIIAAGIAIGAILLGKVLNHRQRKTPRRISPARGCV